MQTSLNHKIEQHQSPQNYYDEKDENNSFKRGLEDVLKDIKNHITKEELLYLSLYKNSKRQRNNIHRVFIKKYFGKDISSSAITFHKKRIFKVLECVGSLLKFKKINAFDTILRNKLTRKQYHAVSLYEQRKTVEEMSKILNVNKRSVHFRISRALSRLKESEESIIKDYLEYLNKVIKFSRKRKIK